MGPEDGQARMDGAGIERSFVIAGCLVDANTFFCAETSLNRYRTGKAGAGFAHQPFGRRMFAEPWIRSAADAIWAAPRLTTAG